MTPPTKVEMTALSHEQSVFLMAILKNSEITTDWKAVAIEAGISLPSSA
jgi:hypothetical protein